LWTFESILNYIKDYKLGIKNLYMICPSLSEGQGSETRQYKAENLDAWPLLSAICDLHRDDRVIASMLSLSRLFDEQRARSVLG